MIDIEKVKDRIRKLLKVAGNSASTDGEIDNAIRFAQSLMNAHHLDEADLVDEPEDQWKAIEAATRDRVFVSVSGKFYAWEKSLATFCAEFVGGVGVYCDPNKQKVARDPRGIVQLWNGQTYPAVRFCFYGISEDAMMAAELFWEMRLTIQATARLKWGSCYTKDGGVYSQGFVDGMRATMRSERDLEKLTAQCSDSKAMILVERRADLIERKKTAATQWLAKAMGIHLAKGSSSSGANGSTSAYREGRADGAKTNVNAARTPKLN